ncbi:MAG: hypothetical protein ABIA08_01620 [bacterium]
MRIYICGSMNFAKQMLEAKSRVEELGHSVMVPPDTSECLENPGLNMDLEHCFKNNILEDCFKKIAEHDAILILNYEKDGIKGYVGGATLMEIGLAFYLGKKIFLLYPPPKIEDQRYSIEIQLAKPIVLEGNLDLIKNV